MFLTNVLFTGGTEPFSSYFSHSRYVRNAVRDVYDVAPLSVKLQVCAAEIKPCVCCVELLNSFPEVS